MIFRSRLPQGSSQELTPAHSNRNDNTVESSDALKNDDEKSYQRYAETSNSGSFPAEKNTEENSEEPGRIILDCVSSVTEGNIQKEKTEGDDKTAEVKESIGSQSVADEELNEKVEDNTTVTNNSLSDIIKNITNFLLSKSNNSDSEVDTNIKRRKSSKKGRQQVVISYPASQGSRQPFTNLPLQVPDPPSYYTNYTQQVGRPVQPIIHTQPREEIVYRPGTSFGPGNMMMMPNMAMNVSYWAPYPTKLPSNVPACLAHLVAADSLFVIQQMDIIELFLNVSEPNYYLIQNTMGQCLYYAYETTNLCNGFGKFDRGIQLHIMDMYHNEIVLEVYSPPLTPVGAITQIHALDFNETEIGIIRRQLGGYISSVLSNTDYFGISFPVDLDVRLKAVFLGALFLISLKRTGWVLRNVEDPETVSGHMYRMGIMTFLIPDSSGVDRTKCMKLSLVHDLAECIVGDLTPFCGVDPVEKHRQEDVAMKELTQMIGDSGVEIYRLYKEYEAQVTDESKYVKDLDRLDMILQAYEYEKSGGRPGKLEEFFASTLNKFHFPWTIDIVKELCKQRNLFINKADNV
ncbi:hypothetical protein RUM44_002677 [Polyplax serrata]|uniref:HD domain-containing protein n=1 Tax=Polyplax serrata TaxID=468196 RepID=A0ABR1AFY2_POLSC